MTRVVVLDDYQAIAGRYADWDRLPDTSVEFVTEHVTDRAALIDLLRGADVVVAMRERTPFPADLLAALPDLRLLVTTGMRNAAIDVAAARAAGITVCGTGAPQGPAAELTWALLLALARQVPAEDATVRAGGWQHTVGTSLAGHTLGLMGLGRLGQRVARMGQAFEMDVLAWSQHLEPEFARSLGVEPVTKTELLRRADVVSLHLRLSDRTRGIVGADELALMKPTGYLINTSRGPLVDEAALVSALSAGRIAGAGLDVFDVEPLPAGHPLRSAPRTVLTPHIGYGTHDTYRQYFTDAVEDIGAFLAGDPVRVLTD